MIKKLFKDTRGVAAVEFALTLPLLLMVALSIYEITYRIQVADELERYNFQLGDYLSRSQELTESEFGEIYDIADKIMPTADFTAGDLSYIVASVGFMENGDPVLLWSRTRGNTQLTYDVENARGLAPAGQSVIYSESELHTVSMLTVFGDAPLTFRTSSVFKPRMTRAIAIDGDLTDSTEQIEGYDDA